MFSMKDLKAKLSVSSETPSERDSAKEEAEPAQPPPKKVDEPDGASASQADPKQAPGSKEAVDETKDPEAPTNGLWNQLTEAVKGRGPHIIASERYVPFAGWSPKHLKVMWDPPAFQAFFDPSSPNVALQDLPSAAKSIWKPEVTSKTDENGWIYGTAFHSSLTYSNKPLLMCTRVRYLVAYDPLEPTIGPATVSPIFTREVVDGMALTATDVKYIDYGLCYQHVPVETNEEKAFMLVHYGKDTKNWPVEPVFNVLEFLKVSCFLDKRSLKAGRDKIEEMKLACYQSRVACVFFSENFFKSPWPLLELITLYERQRQGPTAADSIIYPVFWKVKRSDFVKQHKLDDMEMDRIISRSATEDPCNSNLSKEEFVMTIVCELLQHGRVAEMRCIKDAWARLGWLSTDNYTARFDKLVAKCSHVLDSAASGVSKWLTRS